MATLTGDDGTPLTGRELHWAAAPLEFGVLPAAPTTDENGVVASQFVLPADLGVDADEMVVVSFDGDDVYSAANCTITFHISSPGLPTAPPPSTPPSPAPTPMVAPVDTPTPPSTAAGVNCADRCSFSATGSIVVRFYLNQRGFP